ncbi:hypothetical protein KJ918_02440, partial [Patescibacteria group bacterium]|nr:hypothetical protein [Patescibacteria group bacterium]
NSDNVIQTTQTNENGEHTFFDLLSGNYSVEIIVPEGYSLTSKDVPSDNLVDSDFNENGRLEISLPAKQDIYNIDAGLIYGLPSTGNSLTCFILFGLVVICTLLVYSLPYQRKVVKKLSNI